jgi:hypothetical protein
MLAPKVSVASSRSVPVQQALVRQDRFPLDLVPPLAVKAVL